MLQMPPVPKLALLLLLLVLAAPSCGPDAPAGNEPPPPPAPAQPAQPAEPLVTGAVRYEARRSLLGNSWIDVELVKVLPDGTAERVGRQTFYAIFRQVPIKFKVPYDAAAIDPAADYEIRARIGSDEKTLFEAQQGTPVLTKGHPSTELDVLLTLVP